LENPTGDLIHGKQTDKIPKRRGGNVADTVALGKGFVSSQTFERLDIHGEGTWNSGVIDKTIIDPKRDIKRDDGHNAIISNHPTKTENTEECAKNSDVQPSLKPQKANSEETAIPTNDTKVSTNGKQKYLDEDEVNDDYDNGEDYSIDEDDYDDESEGHVTGNCLHCHLPPPPADGSIPASQAALGIQVSCDECHSFICSSCHWCHEFQANHEIRVCDRCDAFYCKACDEMDQCEDCGEVVCTGCGSLCSCKFCGCGLCEECATACGR
jgi:hypothetical protein